MKIIITKLDEESISNTVLKNKFKEAFGKQVVMHGVVAKTDFPDRSYRFHGGKVFREEDGSAQSFTIGFSPRDGVDDRLLLADIEEFLTKQCKLQPSEFTLDSNQCGKLIHL